MPNFIFCDKKFSMDFKDRIRQRLDELDLKPGTVSQQAGLSQSYLRKLLNPESTQIPSIDIIDALAKELKTTREWLWDGTGDPDAKTESEVISLSRRITDKKLREAWLTMGRVAASENEDKRG